MRRLLALAPLLLLVACRGTSVKLFDNTIIEGHQKQKVIRPVVYGAGLSLRSWNPNGEHGWCEVTSLIHARLVTFDLRGRLQCDLARTYGFEDDGRTLRITLDDGVFHDGRPVTADDVVRTLDLARADPKSEPGRNLAAVERVEATSAKELRVVCKKPFPELPEVLTEVAVLPAHVVGKDASALEALPIGAGPFQVADQAGRSYTLIPHPQWHGGQVRPPAVIVRVIEDDRERAHLLARGHVDLACVKPEMLTLFGDRSRFRIHRARTGVIRAIPLDVKAPGLDDPRVRRALSALVDREALVDTALGGLGRPAYQLLAPASPGFDSALDQPDLDPAAARKLLDDAGWIRDDDGTRRRNGAPLRVRLVAWQGESFRRQAGDLIVDGWRREGIAAEVIRVDRDGYTRLARDLHGNAEGYVGGWGALAMPVSVLAKKCATGGVQNRLGFSDATVDRTLAEAATAVRMGERVAGARTAQRRIRELTPWIPLVYADYLFVARAEVKGLVIDVVDSWYEWPRNLWRIRVEQ
ncbi:MAG: hypothetical protein CMJ83_16475 [Planctomycetes bacterium]|nr:hypothetical protein [Planctomycetota bacterium]